MTAFSLLGASGEAYHRGIGVFALMASSSALVVPLVFFFLAPRVWRLGREHGYLTQVDLVRDRWGSPALGTALFLALVALLVPYLLIGVKGGGITLREITGGVAPEWVGSGAMCLVVLAYVWTGGARGTAWANALQTIVFTTLGALAFWVLVSRAGGLGTVLDRVAAERPDLLVPGAAIRPLELCSYMLVPLSVATFPHLFLHWLTARDERAFRLPIVAYPLCVAAVWLPSVLLGVLGALQVPGLEGPASGSVLLRMIHEHAGSALAGLLAAGVFAAVMSSLDSQTLALASLFTRGVMRYAPDAAGGVARGVLLGRLFAAGVLVIAFALSSLVDRSIFRMGIWSFSGFTALAPLLFAAVWWRRATRAGAWCCLLTAMAAWVAFLVRSWREPGYTIADSGLLPVAGMLVLSATALVVGSLVSRAPAPDRLLRFFPEAGDRP
jgi:SSS family solute:Na+ symporter